MKKKIFFLVLYSISLILLTSCNKPKDKISWIKFYWIGDTIGNKYYDHAAMYFPINIEGIPYDLKAQFDLGASKSCIYENTIKPFIVDNSLLINRLDTLNRDYLVNGKKMGSFRYLNLTLDKKEISFKNVVFYEKMGTISSLEELKSNEKKIMIGTIGADVFQGKILIIDYPSKRIAIEDSIPKSLQGKIHFVDYKAMGTRMRIPFQIDGKKTYLLFDTGASIFSLIVSPDRYNKYADTTYTADTIQVFSWGKYKKRWSVPLKSEIRFMDLPLEGDRVFVNPETDFKNFCDWNGFEGITGNALFLNKTVVIDSRNKRFGILYD